MEFKNKTLSWLLSTLVSVIPTVSIMSFPVKATPAPHAAQIETESKSKMFFEDLLLGVSVVTESPMYAISGCMVNAYHQIQSRRSMIPTLEQLEYATNLLGFGGLALGFIPAVMALPVTLPIGTIVGTGLGICDILKYNRYIEARLQALTEIRAQPILDNDAENYPEYPTSMDSINLNI